MPYATQQNLIDRFGETEILQLTDKDGDEVIDAAVISQAIDDADAIIDGYLQSRYTLPLQSVPKNLVTYACDIARYRLYDDRATEQVTTRYKDALAFLRSISKGDITLGLDGDSEPTATTGGPQADAPGRTFTRDKLSDY